MKMLYKNSLEKILRLVKILIISFHIQLNAFSRLRKDCPIKAQGSLLFFKLKLIYLKILKMSCHSLTFKGK